MKSPSDRKTSLVQRVCYRVGVGVVGAWVVKNCNGFFFFLIGMIFFLQF